MKEIYLVYHESGFNNEDPDFNVTPCSTIEKANEIMENEVSALLTDNPAYADADIERNEYSVYITDNCGNSEYLHIEKAELK